nr:hypothetical protein [Tanacetum cinerariifolium]
MAWFLFVAAAQNTNNSTIRLILHAEKLTGSNFTNWHRNLRIVLRYEKKLKFMEQPMAPAPDLETADLDTIDKYYESINIEKEAKQELFEIVKAFHACKQEDGQSVSSYLLKMKSYLDTFECLGYDMPNELGVSLILNSLNKDYDQFVQNYNMHNMGKTIDEGRKNPEGQEETARGKGSFRIKLQINSIRKARLFDPVEEENTQSFWGYALKFIARILNMVPTKKVDRTLYKIWHGYPKEMMGYYFYYPLENKICVVRNAMFLENSLTLQEASRSHELLKASGSDKKTDMDGNVDTFKARLVAKGFTQTYGVDYGETFSSVEDIRAISILLAIVTFYNYENWQMYVKIAFLNGHLSEDQASRSWNKRFDVEIKKIGFTQNPDASYVYLKASGSNVPFLVLYADDILIMGNNVTMLQGVKSWLFNFSKILVIFIGLLLKLFLSLRNTKDMVLVYGAKLKSELKVTCYANAGFQTDKGDTKSQSRYVFMLNDGALD